MSITIDIWKKNVHLQNKCKLYCSGLDADDGLDIIVVTRNRKICIFETDLAHEFVFGILLCSKNNNSDKPLQFSVISTEFIILFEP